MKKKILFSCGLVLVILIGFVTYFFMIKEPLLSEDIVSIEIYKGQGAGKVTQSLLVGKLTDQRDIDQFKNLFNKGKKEKHFTMNTNQITDYDFKIIPQNGDAYLIHLWISPSTATFIKAIPRGGDYAVDPTPYEIKATRSQIMDAMGLGNK